MPFHPHAIRRAGPRRARLLAGSCTLALHVAVAAAALWFSVRPAPPPQVAPALILADVPQHRTQPQPVPLPDVTLVEPSAPAVPVLPHVTFASVVPAPSPAAAPTLTLAQLAGAMRAGQGTGAGGCDMAFAVQQALRRDPMTRMAVMDARLSGRAILLWDGDWVRAGGQAGKGLSAVREAVLWKVGFAPQACRNKPMHGLVVLALNDGGTRFVIGAAHWRWSDLLGLKSAAR